MYGAFASVFASVFSRQAEPNDSILSKQKLRDNFTVPADHIDACPPPPEPMPTDDRTSFHGGLLLIRTVGLLIQP